MNSWPRMSPRFIVGMKPSSRWRSEPQIAVSVTLMIASRGFRIVGSGTRSTRTSSVPYQQRAFMPLLAASCLPSGLTGRGRHFAGLQQLFEAAEVFANLGLGIGAEELGNR